MRNYALIFPGQGSQSLGMLADLSAEYAMVQDIFDQASEVLDFDLWSMCQTDADALNQTQNTQVAMLCAGYAVYRVLQSQFNLSPKFLGGHSLGEYTALVAGGYLDFLEAVRLVMRRGQLMQNAVPVGQGIMVAILGLADAIVLEVCTNIKTAVVEVANFNAPGQVVIAGDKVAVLSACELLKVAGAKKIVVLAVSVPSHCALMNAVATEFSDVIRQTKITTAGVAVVHNVSAKTAHSIDDIKANLISQLNTSVKWTQSIQFMQQQGVDTLIECGPGKVLSGLNKRIDKSLNSYALSGPEGIAAIVEVLK